MPVAAAGAVGTSRYLDRRARVESGQSDARSSLRPRVTPLPALIVGPTAAPPFRRGALRCLTNVTYICNLAFYADMYVYTYDQNNYLRVPQLL